MAKAGNNSGNSEEVKGAKGKKGKKNKESNTNKVWIQSPAISARQYLQMRKAKYFVVTDVNYAFVHHVQMLLMQATSFYQAKRKRM